MHLLLWAEDSEAELRHELAHAFSGSAPEVLAPGLLKASFALPARQPLPHLAFARQWLPDARAVHAPSIRGIAEQLFHAVAGVLPDDQPWSLHLEPRYGARVTHHIGARAWHSATRRGPMAPPRPGSGDARSPDPEAGRHRCRLIREALLEQLKQKRRHLLRRLRAEPAPFTCGDSLVQCLLTSPEAAFLSVAAAPLPFAQRHLLSPFPGGEIAPASDKAAPSRAFAKLVEAEQRLGRRIQAGETCVDLGASPGSWTYVAAQRGARVIAVDRSPLREDLLRTPRVDFRSGDAFRFEPPAPVDWLLCDVIADPDRTAALLLHWLERRWCRQFIVTLKMKDPPGADPLRRLKQQLPALTAGHFLTRLCANKKELCAFGLAAG